MKDDVYNNKYGFEIPQEHIPSEEDLARLASGDESVINSLIEGLMAFVVDEIEWLIRERPPLLKYKEDIISEAFLALTMFVNDSLGTRYSPPQFVGFAKRNFINAVTVWCKQTNLPVTVPEGSLFYDGISDELDDLMENARRIKETDKQTSSTSLFSEIWFDEFMEMLTSQEQEIIRLKMGGASDPEIGREVGLHHSQVDLKLKQILKKYGER